MDQVVTTFKIIIKPLNLVDLEALKGQVNPKKL